MRTPKKNLALTPVLKQIADHVLRVQYVPAGSQPLRSALIADDFVPSPTHAEIHFAQHDGHIQFTGKNGELLLTETGHVLEPKPTYRYTVDGTPVIRHKHTANGDVAYIENARQTPGESAYHGGLSFQISADECLYGLGQHENGVYNYRGQTEYLYQTNMKISIPFLISSSNYGLLIDTESAMTFREQDGVMCFELETVSQLSYYVIAGENFDEIIATLRALTGRTPMLPRWAFGYIQSKERYHSTQELLEAAAKFRALDIPVDCLVQDWHTWEAGLWGEKHADPKRYPDLKALTDALHTAHVRLMVSIWPNMAPNGSNYAEFMGQGLLLPNSSTYNAFEQAGRDLYWKQCDEEWFRAGIDAWWCDNAEPFSDADWNGADKRPEALRYQLIVTDSQKSMDWTRLNTYGLFHAQGIYENWRKQDSGKRVVNLTRSTYAAGQRYGVVAWSGDISAKWSVLRAQITEGIKFCMSGQPFWTLDIGGFFTVKDQYENRGCDQAGNPAKLWFWNGDYNEGVRDLGYRELYVRWLQYAAFLPVFRAHGTDTPREPWCFGNPGEPFYDAILRFIRLRYRLLPYIYSSAAGVTFANDTLMRSLMFDFAHDANVRGIGGSFMLGRSLLVCPVTRPMYYGPNSTPLQDTDETWPVYLPAGTLWYDFWTSKAYAGGQTVVCNAPLATMPLFVRGGAILPLSAPITYADEQNGAASELFVYDGADGSFALYADGGDGYAYEDGAYALVPLQYRTQDKTLTLGRAEGKLPCDMRFTVKLITGGGIRAIGGIQYRGEPQTVSLS